ncbi:DUF2339 domain-containing protein [Chryseobacterium koreense]|nr:DUF2339 domain-containing protein [Chryseobacterium koreense]
MSWFEILFLVALVLIYFHFTGKIISLKNEISELKKSRELEKTKENEDTKTINKKISEQQIPPLVSEIKTEKEIYPWKPGWIDLLLNFAKQNILTIIGIFTLVVGIGYFVKYAIDKNWIDESMRFAIGILTGIGILIIGFVLKKNYRVFSSILNGGGLAVLYLSITLAFQEYHLFSQNFAFFILILITVFSVAIAWFYDSETIVIFALLGGFGSPLMVSTGVSNYLFLFTYLTFLNLGMVAIAFLKNWKSIGWMSFVITNLYMLSWIFDHKESLTIWFAAIFYLIFYAFALRNYFKKGMTKVSDILLLVLVNISSVSIIAYLFKYLKLEPAMIFPLLFAMVNAAFLFFESTRKKINLFHPIFVGITLSLITIAIAIEFKVHVITSIWAIESVLLFYLWTKTDEEIFKTSFFTLIPLVILAELFTWSKYFETNTDLQPFLNPTFLTGILVSICFGINYFWFKRKKEIPEFDWNNVNILKLLLFGNLFFTGILEIYHQIRFENETYTTVSMILYTSYFVFIPLILSKFLLRPIEEKGLVYGTIFLSLIMVSLPKFDMALFYHELNYGYYLLFLIPLTYSAHLFIQRKYYREKLDFRFVSAALIYIFCFELYHLYLWKNISRYPEIYELKRYFNTFYLPMIWTTISIFAFFLGMKRQLHELVKLGFVLLLLMAGKLYFYDVWRMDNISRIIAFILLGVVLLSSSFTFQKLKLFLKDIAEERGGVGKN